VNAIKELAVMTTLAWFKIFPYLPAWIGAFLKIVLFAAAKVKNIRPTASS
jgi:hypothetical protein